MNSNNITSSTILTFDDFCTSFFVEEKEQFEKFLTKKKVNLTESKTCKDWTTLFNNFFDTI